MCAHTHTHMHTHDTLCIYTHAMEYYSTIEKGEMIPFAATQILGGIMLISEISPRKRDTLGFHLYVKSKNSNE